MRKITAKQNRLIHMLAAQQGMDEELLHTHVWNVTKKEHISSLDSMEASRVIDGLQSRLECDRGRGMTRRQEHFVYALMKKMGWTKDNGDPDIRRLEGFIKEQHGIDSYHFLDSKTANMVIQAFKQMAVRPVKERSKPDKE